MSESHLPQPNEFPKFIKGPVSDEDEQIYFKRGYTKKWYCQCPKCYVINIGDNFNEAIIGKGKTIAETWHKKDCTSVIGNIITTFNAYPCYVL